MIPFARFRVRRHLATLVLLVITALSVMACAGSQGVAPSEGVEPNNQQGVAPTPTAASDAAPTAAGDDSMDAEPTQPPAAPGTGDDASQSSDGGAPAAPAGSTTEGRVRGRVLDAQGNPIPEVAVFVPKGTAPVPEILSITTANGDYEWILPPGTFTVAVNADGFAPASAEVTLKAGETVTLDFTLQPQ